MLQMTFQTHENILLPGRKLSPACGIHRKASQLCRSLVIIATSRLINGEMWWCFRPSVHKAETAVVSASFASILRSSAARCMKLQSVC
jgi:hypothetical protein